MNTSTSKYDSIEQLIIDHNLKITAVETNKVLDFMAIGLNTGATLIHKISTYRQLSNATETELSNWRLIANGTGIHWPLLDEDLSLKGFLRDELIKATSGNNLVAA